MSDKTKANFEENIKQLEEVVRRLEGGDISLDEMLGLFETGVKLTKTCSGLLDSAEQKINILLKNKDTSELEEKSFLNEANDDIPVESKQTVTEKKEEKSKPDSQQQVFEL